MHVWSQIKVLTCKNPISSSLYLGSSVAGSPSGLVLSSIGLSGLVQVLKYKQLDFYFFFFYKYRLFCLLDLHILLVYFKVCYYIVDSLCLPYRVSNYFLSSQCYKILRMKIAVTMIF